jgi:mycothiol synthase
VRGREADPNRRSNQVAGTWLTRTIHAHFTPTDTLGTMRCLEIKRQMASDDIASVSELLDAAARADGRRPLSDHLYLDLVNGGLDGFAGFLASEPGHDHPVAYAQISRGNDAHAFEIVIHPHHRYEMATIGPELIQAALDVVASDGGGRVNWWVFEPTSAHTALADAARLTRGRTLYQMRRRLPTDMAVTIETRAFVPGVDDEAWLKVNNRAFAGHGEQGGWTIGTFSQRRQEPWFDPEGFRVLDAVDDDGVVRMAGFCWTKVHPATDGDEELGEIYVIAVDPDFHGRGFGAQLTLAGLDHLADHGISTGMLYVDADNTPAVTLYQRLGFTIHSTNTAFVADIAPARGEQP